MSKVREWRDLDGKFKQEAIFEGLFQRTKVKLRKVHNGAIVAIPLDRLRPEDRAYVEEQLNLAKVQPGGEKEYNEEDVSGPYSPGVGGGRPSSIAQPSLNTVMNDRIARYSLPVTTSQRTPESNGAVALNSSVANAVKSMPSTQPPQCAEMDVHSSTKLDLTYNKPEESHADQLGSKSHAYANADVAIPVPTSRAWRNQRNAGEPQPSGGFVSGSQFGNGLQNDAEQYPKDPIRPTEMDVNQLQLTHGFSAHAESALYGQQQTKSPVLPGQVPTDRSANEDSIPSSSLILDSGPILTSELLNTATAARSQQRASITPQRLSSYSRNSNYSYREDEDELDAEERSRLAKYRAEHPLPTVVPDSTQSTDYQTEDSFSVDQSKHSETERESSPITRMMGNENDMHNQYGAAPTVVINGGNDYLGNDFLPPLATSDDLLESVLEKARNLSVTSQSTDVSEGAKLGVSTETAEGMTADYGYVSSQSLSPAKTGSPVNAPSSLISPDSPLHITHLGPEIFIPLVQHLDIVTIVNLYSTSKSIRESFRRDPQCWHYMQFDPQHNEKVEHHFVRALIWWLNHHKVIQYVRDICYDGTLVQEVTVINTLEYFPALESLSIRGCYNVYSYPLANYLIQRAKHHNLPLPMLQTFLLGPSLHRGSIPQGFPIEMKSESFGRDIGLITFAIETLAGHDVRFDIYLCEHCDLGPCHPTFKCSFCGQVPIKKCWNCTPKCDRCGTRGCGQPGCRAQKGPHGLVHRKPWYLSDEKTCGRCANPIHLCSNRGCLAIPTCGNCNKYFHAKCSFEHSNTCDTCQKTCCPFCDLIQCGVCGGQWCRVNRCSDVVYCQCGGRGVCGKDLKRCKVPGHEAFECQRRAWCESCLAAHEQT